MKKIALVIVILIILAGAVGFGLQKFGILDLKKIAFNKIRTVPVVKDVVASQDIQQNLQKTIEQKRAELNELSAANEKLKNNLQRKETELENKIEKINNLENQLAEMETEKQQEEAKIKKLVKIYEAMEVEKVAQVIVELKDELAIKILQRLDSEKAGEILGQLPTQDAVNYSDSLSN